MKYIFSSLIGLLGLVSCSHHSFDEVSFHDMQVYKSTFIISSDIRNDISGVHRKAYKDSLKLMNDIIDEDIQITSIEHYLTFSLNEKYPAETTEIIVSNLLNVYEDASTGLEDEGIFVFPILSTTVVLENALYLSRTEPY